MWDSLVARELLAVFATAAIIAGIFWLVWFIFLQKQFKPLLDHWKEKRLEKAKQKKEKKQTKEDLNSKGFGWQKGILYFIFGSVVILFLTPIGTRVFSYMSPPPQEIYVSDFQRDLAEGRIKEFTIKALRDGDRKIIGEYTTGHAFQVILTDDAVHDLTSKLDVASKDKNKIVPRYKVEESGGWFATVLQSSWFPMLLFVGVWIYFMRKMNPGGSGFSSSTAFMRSLHHSDSGGKKTTFADVAGADEAKEELAEIVEFLKDPKKFSKLGGMVPKGALIIGPPGCGKTLLARAVAGEANVPFLQTSGSEFVQMFVGVGASRVRDLFEEGKKNAPCIIFIDEIDAVGKQRGTGLGGGNDEREQTLNQILVAMDGFENNKGIIVLAATNRPDMLDEALRRPGRFDRQVVVDRPDIRGREAILRIHAAEKLFAADVDLVGIARGTPGFTGADLANLVNEAALLASREDCSAIGTTHLEKAKDKVSMGAERKSVILSDADKKLTAYHEAGHTVVSVLLKQYVHKVTIIPRGQALGVTHIQDTEDRYSRSKAELIDMIRVALGGRAAEEIVFGADKISTGAGNDLGKATDIAVKMVCELGMSKLGPRTFGKREEIMFLGRDVAKQKDYSETTALRIDEEVNRLIHEAYKKTFELIFSHRDCLERLAQALLMRETLDASEIGEIMRGINAL